MYRIFICLGLSLLTASAPQLIVAAPKMVTQTDPQYISHKVIAGETLYSLSRKYGVSVGEISKLNPETRSGLKVGQTLRIPNKKTDNTNSEVTAKPAAPAAKPAGQPAKPAAETPVKPAPAASTTSMADGRKVHKVGPKQTLYSVAVQNGVTMAEVRKWNNLKVDKLTAGQELIVSAPTKTAETPKSEPVEAAKSIVVKNDVKVKPEKVKTETVTETTKPETPKEADEVKLDDEEGENASVEAAGKVTETGLAEVITQTGDNNKYLALHKTAPIGTILQVKNIMNGQNVYVRVIGKLPETGANEKVIVRISKKAYQRLAAIDNRFRVEVSYMP